jgi:hypothetical protein
MHLDRDDRREFANSPRVINLNLAFQMTLVQSAKSSVALEFGIHASAVSRMLNGNQVVRTDQLAVIARELGLLPQEARPGRPVKPGREGVAGFTVDLFDEPPAVFAAFLIHHAFGKYEGMPQIIDWLKGIEQTGGVFVDEAVLKAVLGSYRGLGRQSAVHADVADARGDIGQRYGILIPVADGEVLEAVRRQDVIALLLHVDRVTGLVDLMQTRPGRGSGHIGIVNYLAGPPRDIDDEWLDNNAQSHLRFANCLLAEVETDANGLPRAGYLIEGNAGRRDIHLFLFDPSAAPTALIPWPRVERRPFTAEHGRQLQEAVVLGKAQGKALAARVVYDAF